MSFRVRRMTKISLGISAARTLANGLRGDDRKKAEAVVNAFCELVRRLEIAEANIQKLADRLSPSSP
jgi:hypothetical protein